MGKEYELEPIGGQVQPQIREQVYEKIRQAIVEGRIKPGERLKERRLAAQLGVSRTPIREAIRMLELEGLVAHLPRVGVVVSRVSDEEVLEVYRIRAVLEGLTARMAAERILPEQLKKLIQVFESIQEHAKVGDLEKLEISHQEFNDLIYRAAGSQRLYSMLTGLVDSITRYTRVGYSHPGRIEEATREHRQLVEALKMRDGALAERLAREHIDNSRRAYFNELAQKSNVLLG